MGRGSIGAMKVVDGIIQSEVRTPIKEFGRSNISIKITRNQDLFTCLLVASNVVCEVIPKGLARTAVIFFVQKAAELLCINCLVT